MFARAEDAPLPISGTGRAGSPSPLEIEVTALFDLHRAGLLRYLLSFGVTAQDAEEVVQEVFLALFQHLRLDKPRTNLAGWIFRVAHNLGLRRVHAARRQTPERLTPGDRTPTAQAGILDPALNPEEQAARKQRQQRLLAVVAALPEQDQRCLYLRAEGLRYREIVDVLGMSLGAVAQSLERSLARLTRADQSAGFSSATEH